TWLLAAYMPIAVAIVVVSVTFGVGHAYLGRRGIVTAAVVGLVMSIIVLASGWLIPAMVIHALIDIRSAVVGYRGLSRPAVRPACPLVSSRAQRGICSSQSGEIDGRGYVEGSAARSPIPHRAHGVPRQ